MLDIEQNVQLYEGDRELSPRQVARAIGVSESSLKRWCDRGLVPVRRTAGGHRKIPLAGVVRFLRESGHSLARPELLGLPSSIGPSRVDDAEAVEALVRHLTAGDATGARSVVLGMYLTGRSLADIFDRVVAPAFRAVGHAWEDEGLEIYREHRATEIATRLLFELRGLVDRPVDGAPVAIGATLEGDPYTLPIQMAELVLRAAGWKAESLGPRHPIDTLSAAVVDVGPSILWLSVSHVADRARLVADLNALYDTARERGVALVVGGQALDAELRADTRYTAFCESMGDLVGLADGLRR